jgi:hypothetical protein
MVSDTVSICQSTLAAITAGASLAGAVIGGIFVLVATKWQMKKTSRISYISGVLQSANVRDNLETYLERLKTGVNVTRDNFEGRSWFEILVGPAPKFRDDFLKLVDTQKWPEARNKLISFLQGRW